MALANLPYITDRSATPVHHPSAASQQLGELPALTGLRFLAAFFVFIGHATPALVKFSPELVLLQLISSVLTSAGMTLFFTLSGFVIHYNYAEIVESPVRRNGARFF